MLKDFKKFALKGNVIDMAIGVIIGGAFGKIVTSLVNDIVMPLLTVVTGKIKFENLFVALNGEHYDTVEAAVADGASTLNYGSFITSVIDFLIIAASIFIAFRQINKIHEKLTKKNEHERETPPSVKDCPFCKTSIHIEASRCPNCTSQLDTDIDSGEVKTSENIL